MNKFLTKGRFVLATDCPTKLYYSTNPEYVSQKAEDTFLKSLADGGFQVGELAKCMVHGGVEVKAAMHADAVDETNRLLEQENCVIYEAAIQQGNLFARVDILVKRGNHIELIEVKAKSIGEGDQFIAKKGANKGYIRKDWQPYLFDVAFQTHLMRAAHRGYTVAPYLMLVNKEATTPTDGLHQKFKLAEVNGRTRVDVTTEPTDEELRGNLLSQVDVGAEVELVLTPEFTARIESYADACHHNRRIDPVVGSWCSKCEFRATQAQRNDGKIDGFFECWAQTMKCKPEDLVAPSILELWNHKGKNKWIAEGKFNLADLDEDDIDADPTISNDTGLDQKQRQWLQVKIANSEVMEPYFNRAGFLRESSKWTYPYHLIDFETATPAIPFVKGQHPYSVIAFQFSHHILHEDGSVTHANEYINTGADELPNLDFVRELKKALGDVGTIFRFHNHENTVLRGILGQITRSDQPPADANELTAFIESITQYSEGTNKKKVIYAGPRNMVDLHRVLLRHYYHPATYGSNSIKAALPAILGTSDFLQRRYTRPVGETTPPCTSLNFPDDWQWLEMEGGDVIDPYKRLPPIFEGFTDEMLTAINGNTDDELKEGGAASMAYCKLQFTQAGTAEAAAYETSLKRYCELDTLAMVMILEHLINESPG